MIALDQDQRKEKGGHWAEMIADSAVIYRLPVLYARLSNVGWGIKTLLVWQRAEWKWRRRGSRMGKYRSCLRERGSSSVQAGK